MLTQSVGRIATITGFDFFSVAVFCDGTAQPWSTTVTPSSGLFRGGKATASVMLSACDVLCGDDEVTREIRLKAGH